MLLERAKQQYFQGVKELEKLRTARRYSSAGLLLTDEGAVKEEEILAKVLFHFALCLRDLVFRCQSGDPNKISPEMAESLTPGDHGWGKVDQVRGSPKGEDDPEVSEESQKNKDTGPDPNTG